MKRGQNQLQQRNSQSQAARNDGLNLSELMSELERMEGDFIAIASSHGRLRISEELSYVKTIMLRSYKEGSLYNLMNCTPLSVIQAVRTVCSIGVTLNPNKKLAYLIPRKNKETGHLEAIFDLSYMGMVHLLIECGVATQVVSERIFEWDITQGRFFYQGPDQAPICNINPFEPMRATHMSCGAIAWAHLTGGQVQCAHINRAELDRAREAGNADNWNRYPSQYECKTAIRRLYKLIPKPINSRLDMMEKILDEADRHDAMEKAAPAIEHDDSELTPSGTVVIRDFSIGSVAAALSKI